MFYSIIIKIFIKLSFVACTSDSIGGGFCKGVFAKSVFCMSFKTSAVENDIMYTFDEIKGIRSIMTNSDISTTTPPRSRALTVSKGGFVNLPTDFCFNDYSGCKEGFSISFFLRMESGILSEFKNPIHIVMTTGLHGKNKIGVAYFHEKKEDFDGFVFMYYSGNELHEIRLENTPQNWHGIIFVYTPGIGVEAFFDGKSVASSKVIKTKIYSTRDANYFTIGTSTTDSSGYFQMDMFAIWNYPLTLNEINSLNQQVYYTTISQPTATQNPRVFQYGFRKESRITSTATPTLTYNISRTRTVSTGQRVSFVTDYDVENERSQNAIIIGGEFHGSYSSAVHYWPFKGAFPCTYDARVRLTPDIKGQRSAIIDGDATIIYSEERKGNVLFLSGHGSQVSLGNYAGTCFSDVNLCRYGLSVSFWILMDYSNNMENQYIISGGGQNRASRGFVYLYVRKQDFTGFQVQIHDSNKAFIYRHSEKIHGWHMVTFIYSKENGLKYFINGNLIGSGTSIDSNYDDNTFTSIIIGHANTNVNGFSKFYMEGLAFWANVVEPVSILRTYSLTITTLNIRGSTTVIEKNIGISTLIEESSLKPTIVEEVIRTCSTLTTAYCKGMYSSSTYCWPFKKSLFTNNKNISVDEINGNNAILIKEVYIVETDEPRKFSLKINGFGYYAELGSFTGRCIFNVEKCNSGFTISFWIKLLEGTNSVDILMGGNQVDGVGFSIKITGSEGIFTLLRTEKSLYTFSTGSEKIKSGRFMSVVLTFHKDNGGFIGFMDGASVGNNSLIQKEHHSSSEFKVIIGSPLSNQRNTYEIDMVAYWERVLSEAEIASAMATTYINAHVVSYHSIGDITCRTDKTVSYESASNYWSFMSSYIDCFCSKLWISLASRGVNDARLSEGAIISKVTTYRQAFLHLTKRGSYVTLGNYAGTCISDPELCTQGLSVSFWVKMNIEDLKEAMNRRQEKQFIISSGGATVNERGFSFYYEINSGHNGYTLQLHTASKTFRYRFPIRVDHWAHFAFTYKKEIGISVYLDGRKMEGLNIEIDESHALDEVTTLMIGKSHHSEDSYGIFMMDHFAIWTDYLSQYQINDIYKLSLITDDEETSTLKKTNQITFNENIYRIAIFTTTRHLWILKTIYYLNDAGVFGFGDLTGSNNIIVYSGAVLTKGEYPHLAFLTVHQGINDILFSSFEGDCIVSPISCFGGYSLSLWFFINNFEARNDFEQILLSSMSDQSVGIKISFVSRTDTNKSSTINEIKIILGSSGQVYHVSVPFYINKWFNLAVTFQKGLKVYIDGSLVATKNEASSLTSTVNQNNRYVMRIGCHSTINCETIVSFMIDMIAIWGRQLCVMEINDAIKWFLYLSSSSTYRNDLFFTSTENSVIRQITHTSYVIYNIEITFTTQVQVHEIGRLNVIIYGKDQTSCTTRAEKVLSVRNNSFNVIYEIQVSDTIGYIKSCDIEIGRHQVVSFNKIILTDSTGVTFVTSHYSVVTNNTITTSESFIRYSYVIEQLSCPPETEKYGGQCVHLSTSTVGYREIVQTMYQQYSMLFHVEDKYDLVKIQQTMRSNNLVQIWISSRSYFKCTTGCCAIGLSEEITDCSADCSLSLAYISVKGTRCLEEYTSVVNYEINQSYDTVLDEVNAGSSTDTQLVVQLNTIHKLDISYQFVGTENSGSLQCVSTYQKNTQVTVSESIGDLYFINIIKKMDHTVESKRKLLYKYSREIRSISNIRVQAKCGVAYIFTLNRMTLRNYKTVFSARAYLSSVVCPKNTIKVGRTCVRFTKKQLDFSSARTFSYFESSCVLTYKVALQYQRRIINIMRRLNIYKIWIGGTWSRDSRISQCYSVQFRNKQLIKTLTKCSEKLHFIIDITKRFENDRSACHSSTFSSETYFTSYNVSIFENYPIVALDAENWQQIILNQINRYRFIHGSSPLLFSSRLSVIARTLALKIRSSSSSWRISRLTKSLYIYRRIDDRSERTLISIIRNFYNKINYFNFLTRISSKMNYQFIAMISKLIKKIGFHITTTGFGSSKSYFLLIVFDSTFDQLSFLAKQVNYVQFGLLRARINSCPRDYYSYGSYCYRFNKQKDSWVNSMDHCHEYYSHLASVSDQNEMRFLINAAARSGIYNFWIGIKMFDSRTGYWIDGSPLSSWIQKLISSSIQTKEKAEKCSLFTRKSGSFIFTDCMRSRYSMCKTKKPVQITYRTSFMLRSINWNSQFLSIYCNSIQCQKARRFFTSLFVNIYGDSNTLVKKQLVSFEKSNDNRLIAVFDLIFQNGLELESFFLISDYLITNNIYQVEIVNIEITNSVLNIHSIKNEYNYLNITINDNVVPDPSIEIKDGGSCLKVCLESNQANCPMSCPPQCCNYINPSPLSMNCPSFACQMFCPSIQCPTCCY